MTTGRSVLIMHNSVTHESTADARDILEQVASVQIALQSRSYTTATLAIDLRLDAVKSRLREAPPDVVFNLVEAIDDCGQLVPIATALLDHLQIPYTGSSTEGLLITGNKILAKQWLRANGLATADWWDGVSAVPAYPGPGRWITKPVSEDASIGMDDESVIGDFREVPRQVAAREAARKYRWFAERFVEGREINVALLDGPDGPDSAPDPGNRVRRLPGGQTADRRLRRKVARRLL